MAERIECVVAGAGVVGLAVARALAQRGVETVVLEQATCIGSETSSRNSEVIHAGIYYAPNSLKAQLCVAGKRELYGYCDEHGVAYSRCGKLIVATDIAQLSRLESIQANARASGVDDLTWLSRDEVREREPALACVGALLSPSTGIIDSHGFMLSLQGELEDAGGMLAFGSPVLGGRCVDDGVLLQVGGEQPMELHTRLLINCAGLHAQALASKLAGFPAAQVPSCYYAKGNYYNLTTRSPFQHLIYPVPEKAGLGVHLTLDLAGAARFGPDVEWVEAIDYCVDPARADGFYDAIRRYWPDLPDNALAPGYAGIRPKLQAPGEPAADFRVEGEGRHGVRGVVNLFGIESPGLTASLAIADYVCREVFPI